MVNPPADATMANAALAAKPKSGGNALVTFNWNPATQLTHYLAAQAKIVAGQAGEY